MKTRSFASLKAHFVFAASAGVLATAGLLTVSSPTGAAEFFDKLKRPFSKQEAEEPAGTAKSGKAPTNEKDRAKNSTISSEVAKGRMHERVGDWEKARGVYESLIKKYPNEPDAYHRLGVVGDQQRRFTEAQTNFTEALRMRPRDPEIHNDLGYCFFLQGKLDKAESSILKAVQIDAKNPRYHNNLGMVIGHKGKFPEAFTEFSKAGSEADAFYNLAFVYSAKEQYDQAKECFKRALAVDPKHDQSRKALQAFDVYEASARDGREIEAPASGGRWIPYQEGGDKGSVSPTTTPPSTAQGQPISDSSVKRASYNDAGMAPTPNRQVGSAGRAIHNQSRGLLDRNMSSQRDTVSPQNAR